MYAQRDYPQILGNPPNPYTIAQIGCFLTSFCNLRTRYGRPVDPPTLNNFFRDHGLYLDIGDPGRDGLAFSSISQYDPNVVLTATGLGAPPSNNAIVKFIYNGGLTHFCLVNDVNNGTIVDSWDGQVKSWNVYGGPKSWATYKDNLGGGSEVMADITNAQENELSIGVTGDMPGVNYDYRNSKPNANTQDLDELARFWRSQSIVPALREENAALRKQLEDAGHTPPPPPPPTPLPTPDPVPTPEPEPTPDPTPTPPSDDKPPNWFVNFWQSVANAILAALGRK